MNIYLIKTFSPEEVIGVKEPGALEMSVNQLNQEVFGKELYPTVEEKAAILVINLIKKHCFHNGNKRTAMMALIVFLKINGMDFKLTQAEEVEFALNIATFNGDFDTLKDKTAELIRSIQVK